MCSDYPYWSAVEASWSGGETRNAMGLMVNTVLSTLEDLDSHVFEKFDPEKGHSLDSLYSKLFGAVPNMAACNSSGTSPNQIIEKDTRAVLTLCEWATTDQRSGSHRST